jgi:hypothetical protein
VHTRRRIGVRWTTAFTRCKFGNVRFLVLRFEWLTEWPTIGPLPQISHLLAIEAPSLSHPHLAIIHEPSG